MKTEAKGGLYYAYKRISKLRLKWKYKHFGQFTIKNSYKKWTIFKKSWTKKLSLPSQYSKSFPVAVAPKPIKIKTPIKFAVPYKFSKPFKIPGLVLP